MCCRGLDSWVVLIMSTTNLVAGLDKRLKYRPLLFLSFAKMGGHSKEEA